MFSWILIRGFAKSRVIARFPYTWKAIVAFSEQCVAIIPYHNYTSLAYAHRGIINALSMLDSVYWPCTEKTNKIAHKTHSILEIKLR